MMNNRNYRLAALLLCGISLTAQAGVTASVNKYILAPGETIQLRIQRDGSADGQPDISPLKKDFDVLGSSSGSNVQIINGRMSRQTQVNVLLAPRHDGKIRIPPLRWDGEQSAELELTVGASGAAGAAQASDNAHIFLSTALDQKQPYVQAAVVLTVRLYADQSLYQASLDFPASSDVLVRQLGKDISTNETRNGRTYQVVERKYLLFPQRSGKLNLNGPVLDAQVQDSGSNDQFDNLFRQMPFGGMASTTRPVRVHAKPVELNVLPRPAGAIGTHWLPAQKMTLTESTGEEQVSIHVGEPLTRHLRLEAVGLTGAQIPDPYLFMSVPEGVKAYPDQAVVADNPQGNSVLGSREQNIALIASRPGHYELPAVRIQWWDTLRNEAREITLPARTMNVLPAVAGSAAMTLPPGAQAGPALPLTRDVQASPLAATNRIENNNQSWMWLSFVFAVLWLGTSAAWWRAHRHMLTPTPAVNIAQKNPQTPRAGSEFKAVKRACRDNDAHAARKHLLAWACTAWPAEPPAGLNELSRRMSDAKVAEELRQLDRACYTGSAWQGGALAQSLPESPARVHGAGNKQQLPGLYQ